MKDDTLTQEKTRLAKLQANMLELELAEKQEKLILFDDMVAALSDVALAFRAKLLNIPSKLATRLAMEQDPIVVEEILRKEHNEALNELSRIDVNGFSGKQTKSHRAGATAHKTTP